MACFSVVWYLLESNQRHKDFQSFALPTELRYPTDWVAKVMRFLSNQKKKSS